MRNPVLTWSLAALLLAGCAAKPLPQPSAQEPAAVPASASPPAVAAESPPPAATAPAAETATAAPPSPAVAQSAAANATSPRASSGTARAKDDARRHLLRGTAAVEMAKSQADLDVAADEFRQAIAISPRLADAWRNLGMVQAQLGHYGKAIANYRRYLALAPGAEDAQRVKDEIVKLEFRQEVSAKSQARIGVWVAKDGTPYNLTLDGNRLTLKTDRRRVPEDEVRATYSLVGDVPINAIIPTEYQLVLQGDRLSGTWSRGAVQAEKCTVPSDTAPVTGEMRDRDHMIVLRHERTRYEAATYVAILGDDSCGKVRAVARQSVNEILYGPLARGGLGVTLNGLTSWGEGGFSVVRYGWQGRLAVAAVQPGSPALAAGLRAEDEILAIDGVAVKGLAAGEAVVRLRGKPGSSVTLAIWRKGIKNPFNVTVRRGELSNVLATGADWIN